MALRTSEMAGPIFPWMNSKSVSLHQRAPEPQRLASRSTLAGCQPFARDAGPKYPSTMVAIRR